MKAASVSGGNAGEGAAALVHWAREWVEAMSLARARRRSLGEETGKGGCCDFNAEARRGGEKRGVPSRERRFGAFPAYFDVHFLGRETGSAARRRTHQPPTGREACRT